MFFTPSCLAAPSGRTVTCHRDERDRHTYPNTAANVKSIMSDVDHVIAEGRALTRALAVVEANAPVDAAQRACTAFLENLQVDSAESLVIDCAVRIICGLPPSTHTVPQWLSKASNLEELLLHEGSLRWLEWGGVEACLAPPRAGELQTTSQLDRMALTQWLEAVDYLRHDHRDEARRFFRRAVTLGGLYGTASNPVIQWTYAASFFPTP